MVGAVPRIAADLCRVPGQTKTAGDADRGLYAADRIPDGVAAAGIFRQDRADAGAAGNGVAGVRLGDFLHRASDWLSLVHLVDRLGAVSAQPATGLEVLSRP